MHTYDAARTLKLCGALPELVKLDCYEERAVARRHRAPRWALLDQGVEELRMATPPGGALCDYRIRGRVTLTRFSELLPV